MGLQGNRPEDWHLTTLDRRFIRENPDAVRVAVRVKGINLDVDELLSLDQASRELQRELDEARTRRKSFPKECLTAMRWLRSTCPGCMRQWFGASLGVASYCDYRIDFRAMLTGPLYPVPGAGYGYAVGCRGKVVNGVPHATTIQYDPPFRGLRTVDLPGLANAPGLDPTLSASVDTGRYHHWVITVRGNQMLAALDGKPYQPVDLDTGSGNAIIIRVWNSEVQIRDMRISSIRPAL